MVLSISNRSSDCTSCGGSYCIPSIVVVMMSSLIVVLYILYTGGGYEDCLVVSAPANTNLQSSCGTWYVSSHRHLYGCTTRRRKRCHCQAILFCFMEICLSRRI